MKNEFSIFSFFLLLIVCFNLKANDQEEMRFENPEYINFTISGTVFDKDGIPLEGALVYLHETLNSSTTDKNGVYEITHVKPGSYHLHIRFLGFEAHAKTISVRNQDLSYQINLSATDLELSEVIVESQILKRKEEEKSLSLNVLTAENISKAGGNTLVHALEQVPGVHAMSTGTNLSKPVIRGLAFNRVQVNENGIRQEGQQWGEEHGLEIDQFAVERVEVVRGASTLIYGSDAIGGVINISPQTHPNINFIKGGIDFIGKSNNQLLGSSAHVHFQKNRKFVYFRASILDYADFNVPADSFHYNGYIFALPGGNIKNTAGNEHAFTFRTGIRGDAGSTMLQASYINQKAGLFPGAIGVPRSYRLEDDGNNRNIDIPRQEVQHFKITLNNTLLFKNNWLDIDLGYQHNARKELSFPHAHGFTPVSSSNLALGLNLSTYTGHLRYHQYWNEQFHTIAGISSQYQTNNISGFEFLIPEYYSFQTGTFFYNEWKASENWILNAGIRYDYGNFNITEYLEPIYQTQETIIDYYSRAVDTTRHFHQFSAGFGFSYLPSNPWNVKFNFGRSFKIPSIAELASNGVHHSTFRHETGNIDLENETGYQFDVSLNYRVKSFRLEFTPFFNYFDNYIFLKPSGTFSHLPHSGQLYHYHQADAIHTGFEGKFEFHPLRKLRTELSLGYVFAHNIEENYPLPNIPPLTSLATVEYKPNLLTGILENTYFRLQGKFTTSQDRVERNERSTNGYFVLNSGIGSDIMIRKQKLGINFKVENLLNNTFYNHLSYYRMLNLPEQGRNFSLHISIPIYKSID